MPASRIDADVKGTFTDLVTLVDGEAVTAKILSTPDQADGAIRVVEAAPLTPSHVAAARGQYAVT